MTSELFYPKIWKKYAVYSAVTEATIRHFNGDINEIELEHPINFFEDLKNGQDGNGADDK